MKRIISLGLAALILLGTLTGVLMSAAYAAVINPTSSSSGSDSDGSSGTPNILTSSGILIESYKYSNRTLTLVLVDTNVPYSSSNTAFQEFYAALLTGNFYPKTSSIAPSAEVLSASGEKNLRFKVTFKDVSFDGNGTEAKFRMYYKYPSASDEDFYEYVVSADLSRYTPKPDDGTSTDPDPTVPDPATPYILVQNYNYGGADVAAGSDFALSVNFYNTSANISLENIIMKVEPTTGLSITGASNTYYIPTVDKKGAMTKSIPLKCLTSAVPGNESVHITFSYEYVANDARQSKSSEETISIPIAQVERFEVSLTEIPTMLYPGDNTNVVLNYVNKGRADIYNLSARIEGNIDDPNQIQNLGNIKAGDSGTAKFSISSMESGGTVSAVITVTYENEKGDVSTITKDFTCEVYDNSGDFIDPGKDPSFDPGMEPVVEETGMRWWQWAMFGIGCLAVGGVSGTWIFLKTKLKREEADDEDI
ncbi:MAG: hypothetical protein PHE47_09070 [Oscillospiraceae bacterium]|nr:hypothetical protein [Oscillospiraceae bacterium]